MRFEIPTRISIPQATEEDGLFSNRYSKQKPTSPTIIKPPEESQISSTNTTDPTSPTADAEMAILWDETTQGWVREGRCAQLNCPLPGGRMTERHCSRCHKNDSLLQFIREGGERKVCNTCAAKLAVVAAKKKGEDGPSGMKGWLAIMK